MTESLRSSSPLAFRVCDLPSDERPRERLFRLGAASLSNEELLALLLRTGIAGQSALDGARRLLATREGLNGLSGASPVELAAERASGRRAPPRSPRPSRSRAASRPRPSRAATSSTSRGS